MDAAGKPFLTMSKSDLGQLHIWGKKFFLLNCKGFTFFAHHPCRYWWLYLLNQCFCKWSFKIHDGPLILGGRMLSTRILTPHLSESGIPSDLLMRRRGVTDAEHSHVDLVLWTTMKIHFGKYSIENEFGKQRKLGGQKGYSYMSWAANMVVGLRSGVPWVMCKENDAPDPVTLQALHVDKGLGVVVQLKQWIEPRRTLLIFPQ